VPSALDLGAPELLLLSESLAGQQLLQEQVGGIELLACRQAACVTRCTRGYTAAATSGGADLGCSHC
jgi:hypothetical protein